MWEIVIIEAFEAAVNFVRFEILDDFPGGDWGPVIVNENNLA
jgi:hypothetical protein